MPLREKVRADFSLIGFYGILSVKYISIREEMKHLARYGFIRTKEDIKFLVLYAMQFLDFPVTFESVVDICTWCDDGFNYFELQEAFREMVETGHIADAPSDGEPLYVITEDGCEAARLFEGNLPYTVREAAQASALRVVRQLRRDAALSTAVEKRADNDLIVQLSMQDVFSLRMNVVSRAQASMLERNFRKNAEKIYNVLLDALIRAYDEKEDDPKT